MRKREPWQHDWSKRDWTHVDGGKVRWCNREGCSWQMLSRPNSNRYRSGPDGAWRHEPKDCKGNDACSE